MVMSRLAKIAVLNYRFQTTKLHFFIILKKYFQQKTQKTMFYFVFRLSTMRSATCEGVNPNFSSRTL